MKKINTDPIYEFLHILNNRLISSQEDYADPKKVTEHNLAINNLNRIFSIIVHDKSSLERLKNIMVQQTDESKKLLLASYLFEYYRDICIVIYLEQARKGNMSARWGLIKRLGEDVALKLINESW